MQAILWFNINIYTLAKENIFNSQAVGVRYCLGCRKGLVSPICVFLINYVFVNKNRHSKMKFFWCQAIFFRVLWFQNGCKNEFQKNDFRADGTHESHPTAWEIIHLLKRSLNKFQNVSMKAAVKMWRECRWNVPIQQNRLNRYITHYTGFGKKYFLKRKI